jgi:hypothetical protein
MALEKIVDDVNRYIEMVESALIKSSVFADVSVKFTHENMAENIRRYFVGKGFNVELKKCTHCRTYDIIIRK